MNCLNDLKYGLLRCNYEFDLLDNPTVEQEVMIEIITDIAKQRFNSARVDSVHRVREYIGHTFVWIWHANIFFRDVPVRGRVADTLKINENTLRQLVEHPCDEPNYIALNFV